MVAAVIALSSFAQKKPKIAQAETLWKEGSLLDAKAIVDEGITHEKTMGDSKTWFIRGLVYSALDTSSNAAYNTASSEPMKEAMAAFAKASELKKSGENFTTTPLGLPITQSQVIEGLWSHYINAGVEAFQNEESEKAANSFEMSQVVLPDSLIGYYYAGLASLGIEEFDRSLNNFLGYIERDGDEIDAYERAIYLLSNVKKDNEKAFELVEKGKAKFPGSKSMSEWEFRLLYAMDKIDEAIEQLKGQITADPTNAELRFNLGVMYESAEKFDLAKEQYIGAIKVDPDYYNANFNLGVMYRNGIVEISKEKNNLGYSKADQARDKELTAELIKACEEALPFWEKCNSLQPDEQTTLETLQYIYMQQKDYDKAEVISKQMEDLGFKENEK